MDADGAALAELERFVTVCDHAQIERATEVDLGQQLLILLRDDRFTEAETLVDGLDTDVKTEADR